MTEADPQTGLPLKLAQLSQFSQAEISRLHGIRPNAVEQLRRALAEGGLAFQVTPQR